MRTPEAFRRKVDADVRQIVVHSRNQVLETETDFKVENPEDSLRRRLLKELSLPVAGSASLGTDQLPEIEHWPEPGFPAPPPGTDSRPERRVSPLRLSLYQSMEIGAQNSFEYQTRKEAVFQAALALYIEQDVFRNRFIGQVQQLFSADLSTALSRKVPAPVDPWAVSAGLRVVPNLRHQWQQIWQPCCSTGVILPWGSPGTPVCPFLCCGDQAGI